MDIQYFDERSIRKIGRALKYEIKKVQIARTYSERLSFTLEGVDEKGELKNIFFKVPARFIDPKNTK